MPITHGGSEPLSNDINVTPMIDVLLVLLVIFMLALPLMRKAIDVQLPDPSEHGIVEGPVPLVLEVLPGNAYRINGATVTKDGLSGRLKVIFDPRPMKIIFVKGDPSVKFQDVFFAMDQARAAGVKVIGIPPR